jgi:TIR domain
LKTRGIRVVLDEYDFEPNRNLTDSMAEAVDDTDLTVCLLSPGYFAHPDSTMYELNRSAKNDKCWPLRVGMTFSEVQTALGRDLHGLADRLLHEYDPYRPEERVAEIVRHLSPNPPKSIVSTTISKVGSHEKSILGAESIVISAFTETQGFIEVSTALKSASTKPNAVFVSTSDEIFNGGDVQIVGSIEVDATVSCSQSSVGQLFALVTYAEGKRRFLLRRIRCGSTYLTNEPIDFISIALPPIRVTPKEAGYSTSSRSYFLADIQIGIELVDGTGPISIEVRKAILRVSASGLHVLQSTDSHITLD